MQWTNPAGFRLSNDKADLDFEAVCAFCSQMYWAEKRTREDIRRSIDHSEFFYSLFEPQGEMVGCARVASDLIVFYYIFDVWVELDWRGRGLGLWLMECILATPQLKDLRGLLTTQTAAPLYARLGFRFMTETDHFMFRPGKL